MTYYKNINRLFTGWCFFYLPALVEGFFGSKRWMAAELGKVGGKASTEAKVAAARENGKLGGRPKKQKALIAA